jgi:hypothetical protein
MWKGLFAALLGIVTALGLFTWWALESSGVVVITTQAEDGAARETHVWFVENRGELWLEAGTPEHPWYVDVLRNPKLRLRAKEGPAADFHARPMPERSSEVRSLLSRKYGVRDRWIGLFVDSSQSVAVRLLPAALIPRRGS